MPKQQAASSAWDAQLTKTCQISIVPVRFNSDERKKVESAAKAKNLQYPNDTTTLREAIEVM